MINIDYLNRLISLVKQGLITIENIKIQEYKDAANKVLNSSI